MAVVNRLAALPVHSAPQMFTSVKNRLLIHMVFPQSQKINVLILLYLQNHQNRHVNNFSNKKYQQPACSILEQIIGGIMVPLRLFTHH